MTTGHAFMNTLGAAVAEIKSAVEANSFLKDADKITNISSAQKALLETVGAAFAAANFFAGEDIASVFQISLKGTKNDSVSDNAIPGNNLSLSSMCCLLWQWDPNLKTLVCVKRC